MKEMRGDEGDDAKVKELYRTVLQPQTVAIVAHLILTHTDALYRIHPVPIPLHVRHRPSQRLGHEQRQTRVIFGIQRYV